MLTGWFRKRRSYVWPLLTSKYHAKHQWNVLDHCIWLNNCVGKRNYQSFFTFITCTVLLCCYVFAFTLVQLISIYLDESSGRSFKYALSQAPVSFLLLILCALLCIPVGGLTGYHCFLVMGGVTTHEQVWMLLTKSLLTPTGRPDSCDLRWLCDHLRSTCLITETL